MSISGKYDVLEESGIPGQLQELAVAEVCE